MTPSRLLRVLFLGSIVWSMAGVIVWAGYVGWRKWPEVRAVPELRAAVEANEAEHNLSGMIGRESATVLRPSR